MGGEVWGEGVGGELSEPSEEVGALALGVRCEREALFIQGWGGGGVSTL